MAKCNQFLKTLNKLDLKMKQMRAQSEEVRLFYDVGLFPDTYDRALDLEETMEQAVLLSRALPAYTGAPYAEKAVEERIQAAVPVHIGFTEHGCPRKTEARRSISARYYIPLCGIFL